MLIALLQGNIMAKLQKSFEDFFRIPVLLKGLGQISQEALSNFAAILNTVQAFPINKVSEETYILQQNLSNTPLSKQLKEQFKNRSNAETQKLLFLCEDFQNDWPEYQIIYKCKFVIAVYESIKQSEKTLSEGLEKLKKSLKDENLKLVGIILLNDEKNQAKDLTLQVNSTILPMNLSAQETAVFIYPWLEDILYVIEQKLVQCLLQYRQQDNNVIVFNKNQEKSQPKVMKKKKKYRCVKLCGDVALMLHFYKLAYETYNQAEQQLRKIDDYLWVLGCVQGKLACMTSQFQIPIQIQNFQQKIEELIQQSYALCKKVKQTNLQIENNFKILKLFMDQPQRFDEMLLMIISGIKLYTEQQKFIYWIYLGSMYQKCGMLRKRNYYYYLSSLTYLNHKTDISLILLKKIKESLELKQWEQLHAKVIKLIIDQEGFFNKFGELQLQLLEECSNVLTKKDIEVTLNQLNFNHYENLNLQTLSLVQVKQFNIMQSLIKPKLNRIGSIESPKRNASSIFMGWKKNQNFLFQEDEDVVFKGNIYNKMTFAIHLTVQLELFPSSIKDKKFDLLLSPQSSAKFEKSLKFKYCQSPIQIRRLKLKIWNFCLFKELNPSLKFQTYEKQPDVYLDFPSSIEIEESQQFKLSGVLKYEGKVKCDKIRLSLSIYYDIDVGFQENQYQIQDITAQAASKLNSTNILKFFESNQQLNTMNIMSYKQTTEIIFKLKKLKAHRKHIKKIEISLEYVQTTQSKYQIQKQYSILTKVINSIWGKLKGYQSEKIHHLNKQKGHNYIQDNYIAKIQFFKNNDNLAPYRITYLKNGKEKTCSQIILSDKTSGCINLMLSKYPQKYCKQKVKEAMEMNQNIKENEFEVNAQFQNKLIVEKLTFYWQNIVNPQINGVLTIEQEINELMFKPSYKVHVQIQKITDSEFAVLYDLQANDKQDLSHYVLLRSVNDNSDNFIVKGKTKIKNNDEKVQNKLIIKLIQKQSIQKKDQRKSLRIQFELQFESRWKYLQILALS